MSDDKKITASPISLFLSVLLILAYPLLGMAWYHGYPVLSPEIFAIIALFAVLAVLAALLLRLLDPRVANIIIGLIVLLALTVHFNFQFLGMLATFVAVAVAGWLAGYRLPGVLPIIFLALIVGSFLDNRSHPAVQLQAPEQGGFRPDGTIVHIVMDALPSQDGFPGGVESGDLGEQVTEFFASHGFEIHTRSYTHYSNTTDSLSRAYAFSNGPESLWALAQLTGIPVSFTDNRWFQAVEKLGYEWSVYQTESMDFCQASLKRPIACNVFPMPYLKSIREDELGTLTRAKVLLSILLKQSTAVAKALTRFELVGSWGVSVYDPRTMKQLTEDVVNHPGRAYFAHVLVPHSPLVFDEQCNYDYSSEPWLRYGTSVGLIGNSPESRAQRYQRIVPQVKCGLKLLDELFNRMKQAGAWDDATIIIHGDHGSSATVYSPSVHMFEYANPRDFRETFSALFAIRTPGGQGQVIEQPKSLNILMAETAQRLTGQDPSELGVEAASEEEPFVYMIDEFPMRQVFVDIYADLDKAPPEPEQAE